jgi:hypothetical protein
MKRVLGIVLALVSMGFTVSADAKAANVRSENSTVANAAPQWRYGRRYDRRYDRRQRTVSRVVRYGRRLYRETYLVTYRPNGRYNSRLIRRVRIG